MTEQNRKWWILAAMTASLSLVFVDQTALTVALPQLQRDLQLSNTGLQWVINAYLLALATLVIFGGKLGDFISHRTTFLSGLTIFALACIGCAFATTASFLILARILQGVGGALLIPSTSAILVNNFEDHERGKVFGIYIGIASIFLSVGPFLGGLLTQYLSWRWVFWLNLPFAFVSMILSIIALPVITQRRKLDIDWLGFGLITTAILCLILGLMEAVNWGWNSPIILSLFIATPGLLGLFIWQQKHSHNPYIDLSIFHNTVFLYSSIILALIQLMGMSIIFWAIYIQNVLHFSASLGGLALLPVMICLTFMGPIAGILRDKFGPRIPIFYGSLLVTLSMVWIGLAAEQQNYAWLFPGLFLYGLGAPLIIGNCAATAITAVSIEQRGLASGLLNAARQLGSVLGIAVLTTILLSVNRYEINRFLQSAPNSIRHLEVHQIEGLVTHTTSTQILNSLSADNMAIVHTIATNAYVSAFSCMMYVVAFLAFITCLLSRKMPKK